MKSHPGWVLQVYKMSDLASQESAAEQLAGISSLIIDVRSCERGDFLIVECTDGSAALGVYELMMMTDSGAELIHSTTERRAPVSA